VSTWASLAWVGTQSHGALSQNPCQGRRLQYQCGMHNCKMWMAKPTTSAPPELRPAEEVPEPEEEGSNAGTVFELAPNGQGGWKETVLHSFNSADGLHPYVGLIFDSAGNLYGTTFSGGALGWGTVFELAPNGRGGWKETVLHSFKDRPGASPVGSLIFGSLGHLYGTTSGDGRTFGTFGSVFEITP
jgi:uncharacterized repeat protein (TIGR03803 family)